MAMNFEESDEQKALFEWVSLQWRARPELSLLFHIPNGQKLAGNKAHRAKAAMRLKKEGMRPGVPDLMLPVPRGIFHGLFIEMKRKDGGVVSGEQKAWIKALADQGYRAMTCNGFDEARAAILEYLG